MIDPDEGLDELLARLLADPGPDLDAILAQDEATKQAILDAVLADPGPDLDALLADPGPSSPRPMAPAPPAGPMAPDPMQGRPPAESHASDNPATDLMVDPASSPPHGGPAQQCPGEPPERESESPGGNP